MADDEKQRTLQEMLAAARGALEDALSYAEKHGLFFEFTGLRRAPDDAFHVLKVNDSKQVAEFIEECDGMPLKPVVETLDISSEWVSSWC